MAFFMTDRACVILIYTFPGFQGLLSPQEVLLLQYLLEPLPHPVFLTPIIRPHRLQPVYGDETAGAAVVEAVVSRVDITTAHPSAAPSAKNIAAISFDTSF